MKVARLAIFYFCFCSASLLLAQQVYYLPQVANGQFSGGKFRTTFLAFNNTNGSVTVTIVLTRDDGTALQVTIPELGTSDRFTFTLDPGASRILQTDGSGTATSGAATVTASAAIGVSAIFSIFDAQDTFLTEAGVGSSDPLTEFVIAVDTTGTFNTGLALFNFGSDTASIRLRIIDTSGLERDSVPLALGRGGHVAKFVSEFFPAVTNFRGTLVVSSTMPVAALTLRQNSSPLSFTTLPVVSRASTQLEFSLPQVANGPLSGGIIRTTFLVFNISGARATVTITLTKDDGSPFVVTIPELGSNSTFTVTLEPGGATFLQTDGLGTLTAGAAAVTSNVAVGVSAIFSIFDPQGRFLTEAGVGDSPARTEFSTPIDVTDLFDTGIAFYNRLATAASMTLRLIDRNGTVIASQTISLGGRNHLARFISELFGDSIPAAVTSGSALFAKTAGTPSGNQPERFAAARSFRGSLSISASAAVAAITLRQNSTPLSLTTLPVASGAFAGRPPQATALLSRTISGVNATTDVTVNAALPPGFRLSGTISGPGQPTVVAALGSDRSNIFIGPTNVNTKRYLVVVPADTYNLLVCHLQPTTVTNTFQDPSPVQVASDTTRDITLPAVGSFNVSGAVLGVGTIPSLQSPSLTFSSSDGKTQGVFPLLQSGSYQGQLPNGTYTASLSGQAGSGPLQMQTLSIFNLGSLTVNGGATGNFSIPGLATVSGSIGGSGAADAFFLTVSARDTSALQPTTFTGCGFPPDTNLTTVFGALMPYQMTMATGRNYGMSVMLPILEGERPIGNLTLPVPPRQVAFSGNTNQDFDIPALPQRPKISGRVTDSSGNGVNGAFVVALTEQVTGIPGSSYSGFTTTDSNGNYSLPVLSGTNYQLIFFPPQPQP
ncbi:MAG: carboxypeptidase regulatory-like domain-containing protein [Acidobacteria bacterium]|nr:carboxypeptidase regulatory-like domain-containing protein [Acidobacteriota bacterium]